ncbi:MAG: protein-export chaperone SecB [Candidatus Eremiobacteraeota bacterium]|nr:protein-export chaperone SecB [Candidatus Eremiobacteraeota bacterium]
MLSYLQLKDFRLYHILIDANRDFISGRECIYEIDADFNVQKAENKLLFKVPFYFSLKTKKNRKYSNIKKIEVGIEGIFELSSDTPEDIAKRLVPYNCLAILYGIARGMIADTTGSMPGGKFILPAINLVELINRQIEENK